MPKKSLEWDDEELERMHQQAERAIARIENIMARLDRIADQVAKLKPKNLAILLLLLLPLASCHKKKTILEPDICIDCLIRDDWSGIDCVQVDCATQEVG